MLPQPSQQPRQRQVNDLLTTLLDKGYEERVGPVMRALLRNTSEGSLMGRRLAQLDEEAKRLAAEGRRFEADNPAAQALLADLQRVLRRQNALLSAAGQDMTEQAAEAAGRIARELSLPGWTDRQLASLGVGWNRVDPEAVVSIVDYTSKPAWQAWLRDYPERIADGVQRKIIRGIVEGRGPLAIAREVRTLVGGLPVQQVNSMLRTLQLHSYRDATAIQYLANAHLLDYQIRIATFDDRVCACCVALHGKRMKLGERVNDHHAGRCTSVAVVKGRERAVTPGPDWFARQSAARQRAILGSDAALRAYQQRRVKLDDFVEAYDDDVFGPMVRQASLRGLLGPAARQYYRAG